MIKKTTRRPPIRKTSSKIVRKNPLDKRDFAKIRTEMNAFEKRRGDVIRKSYDIIKFSKKIIYGIHRDDNVDKLISNMKSKVRSLRTRGELQFTSFYKTAMQEYVEAVAFYEVLKHKKLPTQSELQVSAPDYLMGLCDLTGELMRKANNLVIKGKSKEALMVKELVDQIYGEFLSLDIRDNDLRKKSDQIKYNLRKLEDIEMSIMRRRSRK